MNSLASDVTLFDEARPIWLGLFLFGSSKTKFDFAFAASTTLERVASFPSRRLVPILSPSLSAAEVDRPGAQGRLWCEQYFSQHWVCMRS